MLTLDVSGSMSTDVNGQTRFEIAKAALIDTINAYDDQGSANVNLTLFNTGAVNLGWMSATDALAYIDLLTMDDNGYIYYDGNTIAGLEDGWTNYEAAIAVTDDAYTSAPIADKTVSYFISDGEPTKEYDDDTADATDTTDSNTQDSVDDSYIDNNYLATWNDFINTNAIALEVIGIGDGLDQTYLDMVQVIDGKSSVIVTDETQLSATMLSSIESVDGSLYGDDGYSGIIFGADGGNILEITYDGTTYSYDEANPIQTINLTEGDMDLNFETGAYTYTPTTSSGVDITENFTISVTDSDGDTTLDQPLTMVIGIDSTYTYDGTIAIDAGAGFDTLVIAGDIDLDFSDTTLAQVSNIEKIDLTDGAHTLSNLSLDDVLDMTDPGNELIIAGDSSDAIANLNTSGWNAVSQTSDTTTGTTTYEYSNGTDSLTLTVDDQIDTTGM